ncbi:MAG: calcium-binding protein [Gemmataceae bacterium]|nr:calcium-binding protein [Gemmataceae bacterium]
MQADDGGDDLITAGAGADVVFGGFGSDTLTLGLGDDIALGDNGELAFVGGVPVLKTADIATTTGAADLIFGNDGDDAILGGVGADLIDGNAGNDLILGDNGTLTGRLGGIVTDPRNRALIGTTLYDASGLVRIDRTQQFASPGTAPAWTNWVVTVDAGLTGLYGDDYIAGGPDNDTIFGQRGNDTIQGDGSIDSRPGIRKPQWRTLWRTRFVRDFGRRLLQPGRQQPNHAINGQPDRPSGRADAYQPNRYGLGGRADVHMVFRVRRRELRHLDRQRHDRPVAGHPHRIDHDDKLDQPRAIARQYLRLVGASNQFHGQRDRMEQRRPIRDRCCCRSSRDRPNGSPIDGRTELYLELRCRRRQVRPLAPRLGERGVDRVSNGSCRYELDGSDALARPNVSVVAPFRQHEWDHERLEHSPDVLRSGPGHAGTRDADRFVRDRHADLYLDEYDVGRSL